jgi:hypothetical protein
VIKTTNVTRLVGSVKTSDTESRKKVPAIKSVEIINHGVKRMRTGKKSSKAGTVKWIRIAIQPKSDTRTLTMLKTTVSSNRGDIKKPATSILGRTKTGVRVLEKALG